MNKNKEFPNKMIRHRRILGVLCLDFHARNGWYLLIRIPKCLARHCLMYVHVVSKSKIKFILLLFCISFLSYS